MVCPHGLFIWAIPSRCSLIKNCLDRMTQVAKVGLGTHLKKMFVDSTFGKHY